MARQVAANALVALEGATGRGNLRRTFGDATSKGAGGIAKVLFKGENETADCTILAFPPWSQVHVIVEHESQSYLAEWVQSSLQLEASHKLQSFEDDPSYYTDLQVECVDSNANAHASVLPAEAVYELLQTRKMAGGLVDAMKAKGPPLSGEDIVAVLFAVQQHGLILPELPAMLSHPTDLEVSTLSNSLFEGASPELEPEFGRVSLSGNRRRKYSRSDAYLLHETGNMVGQNLGSCVDKRRRDQSFEGKEICMRDQFTFGCWTIIGTEFHCRAHDFINYQHAADLCVWRYSVYNNLDMTVISKRGSTRAKNGVLYRYIDVSDVAPIHTFYKLVDMDVEDIVAKRVSEADRMMAIRQKHAAEDQDEIMSMTPLGRNVVANTIHREPASMVSGQPSFFMNVQSAMGSPGCMIDILLKQTAQDWPYFGAEAKKAAMKATSELVRFASVSEQLHLSSGVATRGGHLGSSVIERDFVVEFAFVGQESKGHVRDEQPEYDGDEVLQFYAGASASAKAFEATFETELGGIDLYTELIFGPYLASIERADLKTSAEVQIRRWIRYCVVLGARTYNHLVRQDMPLFLEECNATLDEEYMIILVKHSVCSDLGLGETTLVQDGNTGWAGIGCCNGETVSGFGMAWGALYSLCIAWSSVPPRLRGPCKDHTLDDGYLWAASRDDDTECEV